MSAGKHMIAAATRPLLAFFRDLSIRTKTYVALAILLTCFAVLGFESVSTLGEIRSQLGAVRQDTLPKQAMAMDFATDINATHMKVFRFVTLASNGVSKSMLSSVSTEVLSELEAETQRLVGLAVRPDLGEGERQELALIAERWSLYIDGVKDLLDVGKSDAAMAVMMLGATDEHFQSIASHLGTMAWHVNKRTASTIAAILSNVDANRITVQIGVGAGMLISTLVAFGFARAIVRPIRAVTEAMTKVSSGVMDVDIGYRERDDEIGRMVKAIIAFRSITRSHVIMNGERNRLFDAALNNMSHGLCMFDADGVLIVRNNRYLEIFGAAPGLIEPGCTLRDILDRLDSAGLVGGDKDAYVRDLGAALAQGHSFQTTRTLTDGRIIHIFNRPMAGGGWVATHEDVTERRQNEERVAFLARHDALTELPNRLLFRERTEDALALVRRGDSISVFCIDLDHFKEVNDTLGHPAGDSLLKLVSQRLSQAVRETDVLARLGGDEFAVVQTGIRKPEDVSHLASRIIEVLSEPYEVDGHEVIVGASIGIALAPHDGDDPDQLLKSADMALYRAKGDGRGTFRFFEAEMDARLQARRRLEIDLRKAVAQGEFEVHYQPIVSLANNQVTAFEALIRWNHPERGLIMPGDFIPLAEDIGLIGSIGEWVLRQACVEAARWPRGIRVAVNLSPSQFRKSLVPTVVQVLASSGLAPNRLELEITESVLLQNNEMTLSMLRQLHDLGIRISMDDFGTGYSSLSYLHSFPFDKIKIDRSFVTDVEARSNSAAIVRAVAGLGNTLGMKTTAEGVETIDQLDWLRSEGCTEVQGYLFSRARPAHELPKLIDEIAEKLAA